MNKYSLKDVKDIQDSCFRLNSLQLRALLTGYVYGEGEPRIPPVSAPQHTLQRCHGERQWTYVEVELLSRATQKKS